MVCGEFVVRGDEIIKLLRGVGHADALLRPPSSPPHEKCFIGRSISPAPPSRSFTSGRLVCLPLAVVPATTTVILSPLRATTQPSLPIRRSLRLDGWLCDTPKVPIPPPIPFPPLCGMGWRGVDGRRDTGVVRVFPCAVSFVVACGPQPEPLFCLLLRNICPVE
jgi:hypothetical protein